MRKVTIVALFLVLFTLVWLVVRGLTVTRPGSTGPAAPAASEQVTASLDATEAVDSTVRTTRATITPPALPLADEEVSAVSECRIRVHVRFRQPEGFEPRDVAVRVLDSFEADRPVQRESATDYLADGLQLGAYSVRATEDASLPSVVHVSLSKPGEERVVEVELDPIRSVTVHWRSTNGRPIAAALRESAPGKGCRILTVHATPFLVQRGDPEPSLLSLGEVRVDVDKAKNSHQSKQSDVVDYESAENEDGDVFCVLDIGTPDRIWISTALCGEVLDCQELARDQTDVVFTSSVDELSTALVPISLCAVDDASGEPITNLTVSTEGIGHHQAHTNEHGCAVVEVEPGWTLLWLDQDLPSARNPSARMVSEGNSRMRIGESEPDLERRMLRVRAVKGRPIDLGQIRLSQGCWLRVRVLSPDSKTGSTIQVLLMPLRDYDGTGLAFSSKQESIGDQGVASFRIATGQSYVVTAATYNAVAEPIVVDASLRPDRTGSIACDVQMKPARHVAFVFKAQPHPGTRLLVETLSGVLVRDVEVNDFGLNEVAVCGDDYTVHLVEDGVPKPALRFHVTSDPFVLEL